MHLPSDKHDAFTAVALLLFAGLLAATRSLWSVLVSIPAIIVVYLVLSNLEILSNLVSGVVERPEKETISDSRDNSMVDSMLVRRIGDVFVGSSISSGNVVGINLGDSTHFAVYAQSGGGKTTILYSILYDLISLYSPDRVRIAIGDPKSYSFTIFGKAPHLYCPIGRGVGETLLVLQKLDAELAKREKMFSKIPDDRLCENLNDYHRIAYELGLDLEALPWLIAIVDEVQEVAAGEEATEILTRLAKKGRALGIRLILATQRPTSAGLSHEIQSQMECKFVGFMDSNQEYSVARVPPEVYLSMVDIPGRFMMRYKGRWQHVMVERIEVARLEAMLRKVSDGRQKFEWSEIDARIGASGKVPLTGSGFSETQKGRKIVSWMVNRGSNEKPSAEEFMGYFDCSQATAYRKIPQYWPRALAQLRLDVGGEA